MPSVFSQPFVPFEYGHQVRNRTTGRRGVVRCCEGRPGDPPDAWVGVLWDDRDLSGEIEHHRRTDLQDLLDPNPRAPYVFAQPEFVASRTFRTLGEQFQTIGSVANNISISLASVGSQLDVGNPNNESEGVNMPNAVVDTIQVPHSAESREQLFQSLNLPSLLMQGLDPDTWEQHRQELEASIQPITWPVVRGSFEMQNYPIASVGNSSVRIRTSTVEVADQFLRSASNDRVFLVPREDESLAFRLKAMSNLEDDAWTLYGGAGISLFAEIQDEGKFVDLRNLSNLMAEFTAFMRSRSHREYIRKAIKSRMRGEPTDKKKAPTQKEWTTDRALKFKAFLTGIKGRLQPEANPFQHLPILPHKTLSSRTWGIEIEAVDIDGVQTPEYWQLKSDGSLRNLAVSRIPSRTAPTPPEVGTPNVEIPQPPQPPVDFEDHEDDCASWTEDEDNWGDNMPCDCGYAEAWDEYYDRERAWRRTHGDVPEGIRSHTGEWNSPVLRSFHSRGLKYLSDKIEPRDTNDSAGVHVHVGAADLSPAQAIQLSIIYTALEPLFESEYHRGNTRSYCKSPDVPELINRFNQMRAVRAKGLPATDMQFSSRYWTVNLAALSSHKTVEFRAMGSVYNYDHLVRWAYFCRELVNIAKANVPQSAWSRVRTMKDVVTLFSKYGKETPTPEWAPQEIAHEVLESLGSENRRVPHSARLVPGSNRSPLVVNDDYSAADTYFLGSRPLEPANAF